MKYYRSKRTNIYSRNDLVL